MLTEIEFQYLVALLSAAESPDAVQVETGAMIYDELAEKRRDVDVCVTFKDSNGIISHIIGIEAKNHSRKLNVEHIEQLWAKLADMPSIDEKRIVSAYGYTIGAKTKAAKRNIRLLKLQQVDSLCSFCEHHPIQLSTLPWIIRNLNWVVFPTFTPISEQSFDASLLNDSIPLVDENGELLRSLPNLFALYKHVIDTELDILRSSEEIRKCPDETNINVNIRKLISDVAFLDINGQLHPLNGIVLEGQVIWSVEKPKTSYYVLKNDSDGTLFVQCALCETPFGGLAAIVFSSEGNPRFVNISLEDRKRKSIRRHVLR